jgi:hypothetical protein
LNFENVDCSSQLLVTHILIFFRFYLSKLEVSAFVFDLFPFMARSVGTLKQCATTVTGNASVVVFNMGTGVSWSKVGFNHKNRTLWFKL